MQPVYITKNLPAASSDLLGRFSSDGSITTLATSIDLGTGRRILVWGTSALGATVTITGLGETLNPISESVVTSTVIATAQAGVQTIQDFRAVTAVSVSAGVPSTAAYFGTSSQGGTPWYAVDTTRNPINIGYSLDLNSTAILVSFEYAMDYPSYNVQSRIWEGSSPLRGPIPVISSLGSSVAADTIGNINFPIAAWRVTLSSTSSGAGSVAATVIQTG